MIEASSPERTETAARFSRLDGAAIAAIVFVLTALFADILFAGRAFYLRDASRAVFPIRTIVRAIVRQGEFPFWNPYLSAGQPAAANPSYGLFYPPAWLTLLGSAKTGFSLHYLFHFYLAAIGMYLLMRALKLGPPASLFAALSLAMSGWFVSVTDLLPNFFTVAWWPLILLFALRLFRAPNRRDFAIAALLCAMQAVTGEPVALLETWLLIAIVAGVARRGDATVILRREDAEGSPSTAAHPEVLRFAQDDGAKRLRLFLLLGLTAALLASVQLVPAFDLLRDSTRSSGFSFDVASLWSFPPARPLELLLPDFFGTMQNAGDDWWGGALYPDKGFPYILSVYSGIAVLVLAISGLLARVRGWQLALGTVIASYVLAIGNHTPLLRLLYATRVLRVIRYPEKFVLFGLFALVVFAAFVLDALLTRDARLWRFAGSTAIAAAAITGVYALVMARVPGTLWHLRGDELIELARQRSWIAFVMTIALLALLFMLRDRRTDPLMAMLLLLVFVFVDLGWRSWELAPRIGGDYYAPPPLAAALHPRGADFRVFHEAQWFRSTPIAERYLHGGTLRYWVFRNGLFPLTPASWGLHSALDPDFDGSQLKPSGEFVDALWRIRNSGRRDWAEVLLPMANVAWRIGYRPFEDAVRDARGRVRDVSPVAIRDVPTLPRAYFADQLAVARNEQEFIEAITTRDVSGRVAFTSMAPFSPAPCSVAAMRETPSTIAADVECRGRGYLVLSVTPHKYWRATIDGAPAELHDTNVGFQGLVIESGRHRVAMRYSNPLVIGFGIVSFLGVLACVIAAAVPRR